MLLNFTNVLGMIILPNVYQRCLFMYEKNIELQENSGGGGHSYIWSDQGCVAKMGEFSRPETCGWVYISAQGPVDRS